MEQKRTRNIIISCVVIVVIACVVVGLLGLGGTRHVVDLAVWKN